MQSVTTTIIPNQLLNDSEKTSNFCCFAFLYNVDNDGGRTEYVIKIPVVARPKPENPSEEPLPEPNIFHETVEAVNASADRAENALKETKEIRDNLNLDLSEKITRPQTAEVGQVLAVKETDEDGTPTVFEAEDVKVPTKTSELENDSGFLTEHQDISGKLDKEKLPEAIDDALAQAKESGEFDGKPGPKGDPGETTYIENPYDDTKIKEEIAAKVGYSEVVGNQLLMYADDTEEKLLATLELPSGVEDVQIDGTSIVEDGVAEIPAHKSRQTRNNFGTVVMGVDGDISAYRNSTGEIGYRYLPLNSIDAAVKAAMCDGKGAAWTAEEQAAARERMGIDEWESILDITLEEESSFSADFEHEYKKLYIYIDQSGVSEKLHSPIYCCPYSAVNADNKKLNSFHSYYAATTNAFFNISAYWESYGSITKRIMNTTNNQNETTGNAQAYIKSWDTSVCNRVGIGKPFKGIYPSLTIFKPDTRIVIKGVRA